VVLLFTGVRGTRLRSAEYSFSPDARRKFRITGAERFPKPFASGGPISFSSERNGGKNAAKNPWFLDFLLVDFDAAEKGSAGNRPWACPRCR